MSDMLAHWYLPDDRDRLVFHERYSPPIKFEHAKWYDVAKFYPDREDSDGIMCWIQEMRLPARSFRLRIHGCKSFISTGSGDDMGELLVQIALQIIEGMLVIRHEE